MSGPNLAESSQFWRIIRPRLWVPSTRKSVMLFWDPFQQRWNHSSWTGLSVELVQETRSSAVIILFSVSRTSLMV